MIFVDANFGELAGHRFDAAVPVRHGNGDAVRFGGGGQVFLRTALRQLISKLQDAIDAGACHYCLLNHHFTVGAGEHGAANAGVFTLGVFAHHIEVDIAGLTIRQRCFDARHQPHRTQIDVLVELPAELQQRAPQRNVVGHHIGPAHRAKIDRIKGFQLRKPVVRQHPAMLLPVVGAGVIEPLPAQRNVKFLCGRIHYADAFRHHFFANAVARDHSNAVDFVSHRVPFRLMFELCTQYNCRFRGNNEPQRQSIVESK